MPKALSTLATTVVDAGFVSAKTIHVVEMALATRPATTRPPTSSNVTSRTGEGRLAPRRGITREG